MCRHCAATAFAVAVFRCTECAGDIGMLLPGVSSTVDVQDSNGATPLHLACRWHSAAVVEQLLGASASVFVTNLRQEQPLQIAAQNQTHGCAVLGVLLQRGADINHCSLLGGALHYGAQDEAMVKMLVERGCDADLTTEEGWTALHYCCDLNQVCPGQTCH